MTATTPLDINVITQAAALISEPDVWIQGANDDGHGHYCAHGAVLRQHCTPGDQHMWRQIMRRGGLTEEWNDATDRTAEEVAERFALIAAETTAADMADVFGPQWEAIRDLVRRVAALTPAELDKLAAAGYAAGYVAWYAAGDAAGDAAGYAAWDAAWAAARAAAGDAAGYAAWDAAWAAAWAAAGYAAGDAAGDAAGAAAWDAALAAAGAAALALVVRDLIGEQFYDTLTGPLRSIGITVHPADAPYAEMVSA
ncbi:MAG: hypothetical protein IPH38_18375 [Candidatus Microthrix sp.]|nr:hypothetical protein [Candidatus Microthrix sp.]MBK7021500.1 hypothetical protein [Candidatus Microthrix sp.]